MRKRGEKLKGNINVIIKCSSNTHEINNVRNTCERNKKGGNKFLHLFNKKQLTTERNKSGNEERNR
jgi:hypothetical protein